MVGLDENRGLGGTQSQYASWARFSNAFALSALEGISATILVINYEKAFERGVCTMLSVV